MKRITKAVKDALQSPAVKAAIDLGGATARLQDKAAPKVKVDKALTQAAQNDAGIFMGAHEGMTKAYALMRDTMLNRAVLLADNSKRPAYNDDGTTGQQDLFLMLFQKALMQARGIKKTDAYTRTLTGDYRAVVLAVQHGAGVTIVERQKQDDGSVKEVKVKVTTRDEAVAKLKDQTNYRNVISMARSIKNAGPFKTAAKNGGNKALKAGAVSKQFGLRFHGRLDAAGILALQGALFAECKTIVIPENLNYWQTAAAAYVEALTKALTETKAARGAADALQAALAGVQATAKAEANARKESRKAASKADSKQQANITAINTAKGRKKDQGIIKQGTYIGEINVNSLRRKAATRKAA